jgi:hypothetical protein
MAVSGSVIDQEEYPRVGERVRHQIQQSLSFAVNPMQILENQHQRLIKALAKDYSFDRLQRASPPDRSVNLRQRIRRIVDAKESENVSQCVAQSRVEGGKARRHFLAPRLSIVTRIESEVAVKQV